MLIYIIIIGSLLCTYAVIGLAIGSALYHDADMPTMPTDEEEISLITLLAIFWPITLLSYWINYNKNDED